MPVDPGPVPKFSIAIPLYNEEACIEKSAIDMIHGLDRDFAGQYELILVINGSRDRTPEICERLARYYPCVRTVRTAQNLGYGGGITLGLNAATGQYVGFTCGDGQVASADLAHVMHEIATDAHDLVKPRRISRGDGWIRRMNSVVFNTLFFLALGTRTRDINAMPKLWRREVIPLLAPESRDWFIDTEIMIKARYRGLRVKELPIHYLERLGGRSVVRVSTVFQFLKNAVTTIASGRLREWQRIPAPPR